MVLITLMVGTALFVSSVNLRSASDNIRVSQAQTLAEAGLDEAVSNVWYGIWGTTPPTYYRVATYKSLLLTNGWAIDSSSQNGPTTLGPGTYKYTTQRMADSSDLAVHFRVTSTGTLADATSRTIVQDVYVGGGLYNGISYAVLTNNANCVMCHAKVRSTDALTGTSLSSTSPYKRTKFATLDNLQTRPGQEDSSLDGTFYTRGDWLDGNGATVTSSTGFKTTQVAGQNNITSTTKNNFTPVDCSVATTCTANQNFYTNYPKQVNVAAAPFNGNWPDGELPDSFPLPVPDANGDRVIDQTEWDSAVTNSTSLNDPDNPPGSISGSMKKVASTDTLSAGGFPSVSGDSLATGYKGNVVLDGTTTPITLQGTTYIDGDVIIRGKVKGTGKIVARGNVYVVGDVKYACGTDNHECTGTDWKTASDPNSDFPKLGLSAVGNIAVGDFETPRYGDWSNKNFLETENSQTAADSTGTSYTRGGQTATVPGMAWREATLFNRLEMKKYFEAKANGVTYKPRLYKFSNTSQFVFWNSTSDEGTDSYGSSYWRIDPACSTNLTKCPTSTTTTLYMTQSSTGSNLKATKSDIQTFIASAAVYTVAPSTNWVDRSTLKQMYLDSVETSSRATGAFRFDGLLYSANATFALAKPNVSNACLRTSYGCSKTNGSLEIRGSLMSADTGILTPGSGNAAQTNPSFAVYHDDRLSSFVKLRDAQKAGLYRSDWSLER
ncbi:polymer-forming cytoskeletal protein (plasmid) [Deinococcus sp. KNUC1210]|uniref:polymer-forming cytoskeletal protein n=1 Tax=Deinococcus sp. KNUC1210 TaxID=2917691 RepID=UPI001EF0952D|nr:polymer-forming cytoskeletal protein [Deinococcus sp. KNUC1210]ULH17706.1 polymer-forming cytoskeletal protein [Deinococcus sp. KNUC1210]